MKSSELYNNVPFYQSLLLSKQTRQLLLGEVIWIINN
jgi:hypothetical protein